MMVKIREVFAILIIFVLKIFVVNGQLMGMNYADMATAYIDANIDSIESLLEPFKNHSHPVYNTSLCFRQIKYFSEEIKKPEMWALKVIDAWGKPPAGLASGNIRELGHFDQCVQILQDSKNLEIGTFKGQYCLTPFNPMKNNKLLQKLTDGDSTNDNQKGMATAYLPSVSIAACIPASCHPNWWKHILNSYLTKGDVEVGPYIEDWCQTNDPPEVTDETKYSIIFFSVILSFVVISTIYEMFMMKLNSKPNGVMTIFSAITNGKIIFKLSKQKSSDQIECLNGIRGLAISWVVFAHRQTYNTREPSVNLTEFLTWYRSYTASFLFIGTFACDVFLWLSGFLLVWFMLKELNRSKGKINFPLAIINRYLRLTPPLMAVILFNQTILYYLGTGPLWKHIVGGRMSACKDFRWLTTLTYLQNYLETNTLNCTPESWYLAVDFQLFFISIFIVWGIWKWGKSVVFSLIIPIAVSIGCTAYLVYTVPFRVKDAVTNVNQYMDTLHNITHTRMGPFFIGMIFSYFMYRLREKKFYIPTNYLILTWTAALAGLYLGPYAIYTTLNSEDETLLRATLVQSFVRCIFVTSIGWVVFACHYGYGGLANTILSYRGWQPFARLSYCVYLTHLNVQSVLVGKSHSPYYIDNLFLFHRTLGDIFLSLAAAIVLSLMFEMPIVQLQKIIFKRAPQRISKKKDNECVEVSHGNGVFNKQLTTEMMVQRL